MDGISIGNNNIKVADVLPRSFEKKTKSAMGLPLVGENAEDSMVANGVEDGDGTKGRSARTVVTPLAHMPYADQLEHKKNSLIQILKRLVSGALLMFSLSVLLFLHIGRSLLNFCNFYFQSRSARKACPNGISLPEWILKSREIGDVHTFVRKHI